MSIDSLVHDVRARVDSRVAAAVLGIEPGTLAAWRSTGRYNLPFYKVGRKIRYDVADLEAWLEKNKRQSGATA